MDDELFIGLTNGQFDKLKLATIACSSVSLISSFVVTCVYCVLILYYRRGTDRVSLRCVFVSSVSNCVSTIMEIYIIAQPDTSKFCLSSSTIMMSFSVLTATSLTVVGINLLLVFVFNVNKKKKLQYIYYPGLVVYTLLSSIIPIYFAVHSCGDPQGKTCWFAVYYGYSKCGQYIWIWHYAFYMFAVVVGFVCSVVSLWKLIREYQMIKSGVMKITRVLVNEQVLQKQSTIVVKVLVRCVMYTMVPLISSVWNFIAQVVIFVEGVNPPYSLLMFSAVFRCLEGTFVSCIFFSDPTVTSIIFEIYESLWRVYVDEYRCISVLSKSPGTRTRKIAVRRVNVPSSWRNRYSADEIASVSSDSQCQSQQLGRTDDDEPCCPGIVIYRDPSSSKSPCPASQALSRDPGGLSKAYIPYRFPRVASCLHWIFSMLRRGRYDPPDFVHHHWDQQQHSHMNSPEGPTGTGTDSQLQILLDPVAGVFSAIDQSFGNVHPADRLSAGRDSEQTLSDAIPSYPSSSDSSDRPLAADREIMESLTTTQL